MVTKISLDKALAIDPQNEDALCNKGVVLDKLGNHTEAVLWEKEEKLLLR
jgi:Flp pilus assembly protein TadD